MDKEFSLHSEQPHTYDSTTSALPRPGGDTSSSFFPSLSSSPSLSLAATATHRAHSEASPSIRLHSHAAACDLDRSPCATPTVAVRPSVDNRDPRDRRASSAIALLEQRHHSSVVASYDDADILSDDRDSSRPRFLSSIAKLSISYKPALDDDRRGINDTVNTSENDFSGLMTAGPRSDEPPPPAGAPRAATSPTTTADNQGFVGRFRVLEFVVALAMMGFAGAFAIMPTHLREIPHVDVRISSTQTVYARDPTINNKMMPEQVRMSALLIGATSIPIFVNVFINYVLPLFKRVRMIPHDTRDFLLSLALSAGISQLITHFVKNMTGRFRPSFYDMCKWDYTKVWDGVTNLCQDKKKEMEGRRSFPSGHASYAWATLFLLTLYLMGRSRLNCENRNETTLRGARKIFKLFLCFTPTLVASWIAVTRSVDNWHHYADILAGSIIGAFAAGFGYSYNYGSIFNWEAAGVPYQEAHVLRKKRDLELEQATAELLRSRTATQRTDGELSRTTASYMTGPVSGKGDVSIIIE